MTARMASRRDFLKLAGAGATVAAMRGLALAADGAPAKRPNFLFILTDDQRYDCYHAGGNRELVTPAMDRLAAEGTTFAQNTIMGGNSGAVCLPSRAMLMTGASLFRCKGVIPPDFVTLPQLLRQGGYATFATGKWHNGTESILRSFEQGEAIFFGGMGDHFKTPVQDIHDGKLENKRNITDFDAEKFASAVIGFLQQQAKTPDKPFFAYLAFKTPHDPRVVPPKFHQMYDASKLTLPANFMPRHPFDNGEMKIRDEMLAPFPRTPEEIRKHLAAYYAAISATDDQIGRVLKAVDDLNLTGNTVVIFASDNGLAVGQHGLMGKQNLYDHSSRVPLVMRGPGIAKGKRSEALCQLFDLHPTLAAMAGLKAAPTADGRDLGPVLRGEKEDVRDATLHAYRDIMRGVRTHDAKLIEYLVNGQRTTQLFDLKNDPWELKNLADVPASATMLATMRGKLEELNKEYSALPLGQNVSGGHKNGKKSSNAEAGE